MTLHGKNFLGGEISAEGKDTFHGVNPATGEPLEPAFSEATEEEIARAVDLAAEAFSFNPRDPDRTADLLERTALEVEALGDALIDRAGDETALGEGRLVMERGRTVGQLRLFAGLAREGSWVDARIDRARPDRTPVPKPDLRRMLLPLGPVAVFGASNFPLAFSAAGGDTAAAFAAGNPVVLKAHPAHPGTSELVAGAVRRAVAAVGLPDGWFSMVHARRPELSVALVRHPGLAAVGFTGSLQAGRALFAAAAGRPVPIPFHAEMGSVNPVFLLPEALAERAEEIARGLHASVTLGVGQFCTNPGLVFALEGEPLDRLVTAAAELVRTTGPGTMLHAGICEAYASGVAGLAATAGVEEVARTETAPGTNQAAARLFLTDGPTFLANPTLSREVFGPSTLVVRCYDRNEMLAVARSLQGQLTATIHAAGGDLGEFADLGPILVRKVGRVIYGGFPTGVEVSPAMHHGGPYPATTDARATSVGTAAVLRFARPVCFQNAPQGRLPPELRDENVRGIQRTVDGVPTREDVS